MTTDFIGHIVRYALYCHRPCTIPSARAVLTLPMLLGRSCDIHPTVTGLALYLARAFLTLPILLGRSCDIHPTVTGLALHLARAFLTLPIFWGRSCDIHPTVTACARLSHFRDHCVHVFEFVCSCSWFRVLALTFRSGSELSLFGPGSSKRVFTYASMSPQRYAFPRCVSAHWSTPNCRVRKRGLPMLLTSVPAARASLSLLLPRGRPAWSTPCRSALRIARRHPRRQGPTKKTTSSRPAGDPSDQAQ